MMTKGDWVVCGLSVGCTGSYYAVELVLYLKNWGAFSSALCLRTIISCMLYLIGFMGIVADKVKITVCQTPHVRPSTTQPTFNGLLGNNRSES